MPLMDETPFVRMERAVGVQLPKSHRIKENDLCMPGFSVSCSRLG